MSDWTAGYVADIGYTFGYYHELNPLRARLALLYNGFALPQYGAACELGFGQGMSTNIHAAGSSAQWYGTDFNPAQAGFAQELAAAAGSDAKLSDEAFADFCNRPDLPDFDFIGLHGIWSWISDENRKHIVEFVRRKLKVGGVLYISYNTLPGWATFAPMRHLMTQHAEIIGSEGRGIVNRIDEAMEFADKLLATDPLFLKANPLIAERINKMKEQNRHYLAHEYFNRDWHPMHFATMAGWLEDAKLDFACSATYLDFVDSVNLSEEQQKFLSDIPDLMLRQSTRDFMVNNQFRKDYWIKGARRLTVTQQSDEIRKQRIVLQTHRPDVSLKVKCARGDADMNGAIYNPILDAMADHRICTIGEILGMVEKDGIDLAKLVQAVIVLANGGHVVPAQDEEASVAAKPRCDALNTHLMNRARSSADVENLVSPVSGGGVPATRFQQLYLLAIREGKKEPDEWAHFVWEIMKQQGQKLIKEGVPLESEEESLDLLRGEAEAFLEKRILILNGLQIS